MHEQTIICRQLFAGHVVGSRPMKRKKILLRMINRYICLAQKSTFVLLDLDSLRQWTAKVKIAKETFTHNQDSLLA